MIDQLINIAYFLIPFIVISAGVAMAIALIWGLLEITRKQTFASVKERLLAYVFTFTIAALLSAVVHQIVTNRDDIVPALLVLFVPTIVGWFLINNRSILSRVTSACTTLILSVVAIKLGYTVIPDACLLALAIGISALGAQSFLHTKPTNLRLTTIYSSLIVVVTVIAVALFTYSTVMLNRLAVPLL